MIRLYVMEQRNAALFDSAHGQLVKALIAQAKMCIFDLNPEGAVLPIGAVISVSGKSENDFTVYKVKSHYMAIDAGSPSHRAQLSYVVIDITSATPAFFER